MNIIHHPDQMTDWARIQRRSGRQVALVPTMGCLHDGHLALMRSARERAESVVASIFVNPIQFGPKEDFARYPRTFEADVEAARSAGVEAVFAPETSVMYPDGFQTTISVRGVSEGLCGASRPGHFDGVATVVAKLFNLVRPDVAVFGEKDFQQLAVIRRMARDLDFGIEIVGHAIVRETDGLAMSSRNRYLSPEERCQALCLIQALRRAQDMAASGERRVEPVLAVLREAIAQSPAARIDYLEVVHSVTLTPQEEIDRQSRLLLAVFVGATRLIDNGPLLEAA